MSLAPPSGHTESDSFPFLVHSEKVGGLEGDRCADNDRKTEMEDEFIVERQADVRTLKNSHFLSVHYGPGVVLGA